MINILRAILKRKTPEEKHYFPNMSRRAADKKFEETYFAMFQVAYRKRVNKAEKEMANMLMENDNGKERRI